MSTTTTTVNAMSLERAIVATYIERHYRVVIWPEKGDIKGPTEVNWPTKEYKLDDYNEGDRVGLLTGDKVAPDTFLHDIDIDWAQGAKIAQAFLPTNGMIFGRTSKQVSHCFVTTTQALPTVRYEDIDKTVLLELRGTKSDGTIGMQTMVPPSTWSKNGVREPLHFVTFGTPYHFADPHRPRQVACLSAIGMILVRHLKENGFGHEVRLAWAGLLLRAGVAADDVITMGEIVSHKDYCNNDEIGDVRRVVESTQKSLEREGKKVKGGPKLAELIGENGKEVVARISEWLRRDYGYNAGDDSGDTATEFPLTESGDGEHFATMYAGRVSFDARRGRWLLIEDASGLWLPDPVERLRGYAVDAQRARQRAATEINDSEKRRQAWTWAFKGEGTGRLTNLLREARTQPAIANDSRIEPWDADRTLLGVPGGVVDLQTGIFRKARPEERITMRAGIDYDPDAHSDLWENTLLAISNDDPEWVTYLQRLGGYTITGDTSQDKWFIKHGKSGREGKGTIDQAWSAALGDYVLELPSAVFDLKPKGNPDFDLANLPNKRFVLSSETGSTVHLNHDRVKKMTGGDTWRVANKHEKSFEFVPACKLWWACNDWPIVTDDSAAFWARVIVMPFERSFLGKEDTTLRPALQKDPVHQRAILAWLVRGAMAFYRDGLGEMPKRIANATRVFRDVSWPLNDFVKADCAAAKDVSVSAGDVYKGYQRWADEQGTPKEKRLSMKRVAKLMDARYEAVQVDEKKADGTRARVKRYIGIRLIEPLSVVPQHATADEPPLIDERELEF